MVFAALAMGTVLGPAFHIEQLAMRASNIAPGGLTDPKLSITVLVAITLVFGGLAMRRLARVG